MPAAIRIDLCSTAEVAPGNALQVDKAGLVLAVFNQNGELFVTDDDFYRYLLSFIMVSARRCGSALSGGRNDTFLCGNPECTQVLRQGSLHICDLTARNMP
jgi:hypothetical protein